MTRRGDRRRLAILGALLAGPAFENDLCARLRRWPGTLYPDLVTLETRGDVVAEWTEPNPASGLRRRLYRLPTIEEHTERLARRVAMEQRVRDALRARAEQVEHHNNPRGNPMSENSITDDLIRDMTEQVILDAISDIDYMGIGELMQGDPRFNELPQEDFDAAQTRVSDMLSERIVTIRWQTYGHAELSWHTIRRYIGPDLFTNENIELYEPTHADECHNLPPGAVCWFNREPHHSWWPAGLGTWRIRPVQQQIAEDDYGTWMEIQALDEQTQTWRDWNGPTVGELEAAAQSGQEQQR